MPSNRKYLQLPLLITNPTAAIGVLAFGGVAVIVTIWGVMRLLVEAAWQGHGLGGAFASDVVWYSFLLLAIAVGLYNLAFDSVEVDVATHNNQLEEDVQAGRVARVRARRHSLVTLLLVVASAMAAMSALWALFSLSILRSWHAHPAAVVMEGALLCFGMLALLESHRRSCVLLAFRSAMARDENEEPLSTWCAAARPPSSSEH